MGNEGKQAVLNGLFTEPPGSKQDSPWVTSTPLVVKMTSLNKEVKALRAEKEELESYREVQHLHLLKLQSKVLEAITEEKLECASLPDLVRAYAQLKDKEHIMTGKATSIQGIVGYLIQLEQEEASKSKQEAQVVELTDGAFQVQPVEEVYHTDFDQAQHEEDYPNL